MNYILVNIGCIECGVSSEIVGVFSDKTKADEIAETLNDKHGWREGGQNSYEVFKMPELDTVKDEYREFLND